ncbi:HAD-IA family hydrolase [Pigmentibacter sp. JX0631]|uniref:HAD-IA family hydrolase n=1 Tax=Pigmentibacter sp. JX0631 TaxID=2976982 RepID=UPI002468D677|nr:HAD-IA family hydrolase [Pigmentibacter sp. JX0631]WGL60379.1 HAD-IA family hydrolase [Pigmentibacter sp. JX0631]
MLWPEIQIADLRELDNIFSGEKYKNCFKNKAYSGFVFFDIGSVLLDLDWDYYITAFEQLLPPTAVKDHKSIYSVLKKEAVLEKWCCGKMGAYDYAKSFIHVLVKTAKMPQLENQISIQEIKKADSYVVGAPRQSVLEMAKKLRELNFGIGVLSNATTWHEVVIEKKIPLRELFDVVIFSQDVGCEKPDQEIYKIAFTEAQAFIAKKYRQKLDVGDTYFIDDTPANVRAAIDFGWNASLVNLLNENIMAMIESNKISDLELKTLCKERENLLFGINAARRVENIFRNVIGL